MACGQGFVVYMKVILFLASWGSFYTADCQLYSKEDPLVCFQGNQVTEAVTNSESAWAVEFYSSWCGHCHNFAPTWKRVAKDVTGWNGLLKIGVIDCSAKENHGACNDHNIQGYPTVKLFHAHESNPKENFDLFVGNQAEEEVKFKLLRLIDSQPNPPEIWPNLEMLKFSDFLKLESSFYSRPLVLVIDKKRGTEGGELIVRFSTNKDFSIRRVQDEPVLANHLSVEEFPSVVIFHKEKKIILKRDSEEGNSVSLVQWFETKIQNVLNDLLNRKTVATAPVKEMSDEKDNVDIDHFTVYPSAFVTMDDLINGIGYAFHHEIPIHSMISGSAFGSLLQFVMLLEQVFLKIMPSTGNALKILAQQLHMTKADGFITQREWLKMISHEFHPEMRVFPTDPKWQACRGSEKKYRGYPCSVWMLLHSTTIFTHPIVNQSPATKSSFRTLPYGSKDALKIMSSFIEKFFSCIDCRKHYKVMSKDLEQKLKSDVEGIMWAWCAHNSVNSRLADDLSTDPAHPKVQFPTPNQCSECHQPSQEKRNFCTAFNLSHDKIWNDNAVLTFLCQVYSLHKADEGRCHLLSVKVDYARQPVIPDDAAKSISDVTLKSKKGFSLFSVVLVAVVVIVIFRRKQVVSMVTRNLPIRRLQSINKSSHIL